MEDQVKVRLKFKISEIPTWRTKSSTNIIRQVAYGMIRFSGYTEARRNMDCRWTEWSEYTKIHDTQQQPRRFWMLTAIKLLLKNEEDCIHTNAAGKSIYPSNVDDLPSVIVYTSIGKYTESTHTDKLMTVCVMCRYHDALTPKHDPYKPPPYSGRLRFRNAYTIRPDNSRYEYPNPTWLGEGIDSRDYPNQEWESKLYMLIDYHNEHMAYYYKYLKCSAKTKHTLEKKIRYIIKCAAWLFCQLITIHPFGNGNGRLCRLLVSQVLSEIVPFPIPIYNFANVTRNNYLEAIISFQDSAEPNDASVFAALLSDALLYGWEQYTSTKQFPGLYLT